MKLLLSAILLFVNFEAIGQESDYLAFYKTGHTEFLGNFANCPNGIEYLGRHFRNSEAAFQWTKFFLAAQENQRDDMLLDPEMNQFFEQNPRAILPL